MLRILLFVLALVSAMSPASASPDEQLTRCIAVAAERADLSGSIMISRGDQIVAAVYRGRHGGPESAAVGRDTRFNLASVSKVFTAVAIGQLIDAGKLRVDQPIGEVVAGLTPEASRVTIRQLLTHSSGLDDFFRPENMAAMSRARNAGDLLPLISAESPAFPPGSRFAYSNSGFALLGVAIERVSHLTYGEYLRRNVFGPAGMSDTGVDPKPLATLAVGMTAGGSGPNGPPHPGANDGGPPSLSATQGATDSYGSPAGGLYGTAEDLRRFATALMDHNLLSPATTAAFTSPQIEAFAATATRPARFYGFGFGLADEGGERWVGHNGGAPGANAEFWFELKTRWIVSVLSNRDPPVATDLARQARAIVADPSRVATCSP